MKDSSLKRKLYCVTDSLKKRKALPCLPLDLRGTTFQKSVWRVLLRVPIGQTWSYQQVARNIGCPQASRAVGTACAQNPIALLVPCHRIIRHDGTLGGYAWGLEKKKQLLELEKNLTRIFHDSEKNSKLYGDGPRRLL